MKTKQTNNRPRSADGSAESQTPISVQFKKTGLLSIGVYYKNDKQGGLGWMMTLAETKEEMEDNDKVASTAIAIAEKYWATYSNKDEAAVEMFLELEKLAKEKVGDARFMRAMIHLHLLEKYGYLKSDEYNGINYVYEFSAEMITNKTSTK